MGKGFIINNAERNWQARCVYELFEEYKPDIAHVIEGPLYFENFENCREKGYTVRYKNKEVSFAENRNSDDIVVYPFRWSRRSEKTLDRDYRTKSKYFKRQRFFEVFEWILQYLGIEL